MTGTTGRAAPAVLAVALCCMMGAPSSGQEEAAHRIAFLARRADAARAFDVHLYDLRSGVRSNLTADTPVSGITATSSPRRLSRRGSIVCIASNGRELVEIPVHGGEPRVLAQGLAIRGDLAVAPGEHAIAFTALLDGRMQIHELDLGSRRVRNLSSNRWNDAAMVYAPDGRSLAFVTDRDGSRSIAIMQRDGRAQRVLTNDFGDDRDPCFSPRGDRIVFCSSRNARNEGASDLFSIDTSGLGFVHLFGNSAYNASPVFSPDGSRLAFISAQLQAKLSHVLLLDPETSAVRVVTQDLPLLKGRPSFSANGRYLLFEHTTIRDSEVKVFDLHADTLLTITRSTRWECSPSF